MGKKITDLTELSAADSGDYLEIVDVSASASKKITAGNVVPSGSITTDKLADSGVTSAKVAAGFPVQVVSQGFSAVATGTTPLPGDDTIPQNTEGTEFMTLSITPKSATNILVIEAVFMGAPSGADYIHIALFQDSTANALAANSQYRNDVNALTHVTLAHTMTAGTTSATTFKIRAGMGGAGTLTFNGQSGNRRFGNIPKSFIKITEYKA